MDSEAQLQACKGLANHDVLRLPMGINEPGHLSILTKKKNSLMHCLIFFSTSIEIKLDFPERT